MSNQDGESMDTEADAIKGIVNLLAKKNLEKKRKHRTSFHEVLPCYGLSQIFALKYEPGVASLSFAKLESKDK
jgi:hypothetical protein